jgi:hypothetical protein
MRPPRNEVKRIAPRSLKIRKYLRINEGIFRCMEKRWKSGLSPSAPGRSRPKPPGQPREREEKHGGYDNESRDIKMPQMLIVLGCRIAGLQVRALNYSALVSRDDDQTKCIGITKVGFRRAEARHVFARGIRDT